MIARLNIDGSTQKADFLDLVLTLKSALAKKVVVMRKVNGSISAGRNVRDEYQRMGSQWVQTRVNGKLTHRPVRVTKHNRQYCIEYI